MLSTVGPLWGVGSSTGYHTTSETAAGMESKGQGHAKETVDSGLWQGSQQRSKEAEGKEVKASGRSGDDQRYAEERAGKSTRLGDWSRCGLDLGTAGQGCCREHLAEGTLLTSAAARQQRALR